MYPLEVMSAEPGGTRKEGKKESARKLEGKGGQ
jgi:hypothetical protein